MTFHKLFIAVISYAVLCQFAVCEENNSSMELSPEQIKIQDPSQIYDYVTPPILKSSLSKLDTGIITSSTFKMTSIGNMLISGNTLISTTTPAGIVLGIIDNPDTKLFNFSIIQTTPTHPDAMSFALSTTSSSNNVLNNTSELTRKSPNVK